MEISKIFEIPKNTAVLGTDLDAAGCGLLSCTSRLDDKSLLLTDSYFTAGSALNIACRLEFGESSLGRHTFGPHSQRGALGIFGRSITMITREVLELDVRALLTDSSLYCRELPLYHCCSEQPAYLESRRRSAVAYSSISRFCFGVLGDTTRLPSA